MLRVRLARPFALLVFAALYPALAFALSETYEGLLKPDSFDPPIPIVVELKDVDGTLKGSVTTSSPLKGDALIESGSYFYGHCRVDVVLANDVTLRLDGSCEKAVFKGTYMLRDLQKRRVTLGDFRLERKPPEAAKTDSLGKTASASSCLKANTQCLAACPRGDPNVEFMCSNHCRTKLKSCRETVARKPPPEAP